MGEIIWGEQLTLDSFMSQPDNVSGSWLVDILGENYDGSEIILDSFQKAYSVVNDPKYAHIMCSISGGADSDCMLHIIQAVDINHKVDYIWFNTGVEWSYTKQKLKYLENRYGITIQTYNAVRPIPLYCSTIGQPFLNKRVSNEIARGQRYGFQWEDEPYDVLIKKYPKCRQFLRWWCNDWEGGSKSNFNIDHNKGLKQFIIENPPWFKIADDCCNGAKKMTAAKAYKDGNYDLSIIGIRKAEGGVRSTAYHNCFTEQNSKGHAEYRPLFWYSNNDRKEFEERFNIKHSDCYSVMGLTRTGCCSCPFGRDFETELSLTKIYEPKLYVAVNNIFKDAYEYTRMYREFQKKMKEV